MIEHQFQKFGHKPGEGIYGDCHRTCIAMLLGVPRDSVPHAFEGGVHYQEARQIWVDWLEARGLQLVDISWNIHPKEVIDYMIKACPGAPYILSGKGASGFGHSVVMLGKQCFDPSILVPGGGIIGPFDDDETCVVSVVTVLPGPRRAT